MEQARKVIGRILFEAAYIFLVVPVLAMAMALTYAWRALKYLVMLLGGMLYLIVVAVIFGVGAVVAAIVIPAVLVGRATAAAGRSGVRRARERLRAARAATIARHAGLPRLSLDGATPPHSLAFGQPVELHGVVSSQSPALRGSFVAYIAEEYTYQQREDVTDLGEGDRRVNYSGDLAWHLKERDCPDFYLTLGDPARTTLRVAGGGRSTGRVIDKQVGAFGGLMQRERFERGPGYDLVIVSSASPFRQRLRESAAPALGAERVTGMCQGDRVEVFGHIGYANIEALRTTKAIIAEKVVVRR